MLRVVVSMLAAFVGFSLGHSIPKWMDSRKHNSSPPPDKTEKPSSSSSHPPKPRLCLPLRRKSIFKLKVNSSPHRSPSKHHSSPNSVKLHCSSPLSSSDPAAFTSYSSDLAVFTSSDFSDLVCRKLLHDYEIKPPPAPPFQISPSVTRPRVVSLGSKTPELKPELSVSNKCNLKQHVFLQDSKTKHYEDLHRSLGRSTASVLLQAPSAEDRER